MPPKPKPAPDARALIDLTKSTQALILHFQSSLAPIKSSAASKNTTNTTSASASTEASQPNPLDVIKATTQLLKSHTTTLSLLLLNPPFTPSAVATKIGDVSSAVLSGMVAAASAAPQPGARDELGTLMRVELRAQVRRLLGTWNDVLALVLKFAEKREAGAVAGKKDAGPSESEKQEVLGTTGVVWDVCDGLLKTCQDGVVGLVVRKAEGLRAVLLDAVEELKEWGEDVDDGEDEDKAEGSGDDEFKEEDEIFGAANKLGKGDKELKALLDTSVKRLKMIGMLYQALIKRRLRTFPGSSQSAAVATVASSEKQTDPMLTLEQLMSILKTIPETVDDLASAFYDLDEDEAKETLDKCCGEAKSAADIVKQSWAGVDDEFTAWSGKWTSALDAA